jgi:hypothetical protein
MYTVTLYDLDQLKWVEIIVDDFVPCKYDDDFDNTPFVSFVFYLYIIIY